MKQVILGIDPGSENSGIIILEDDSIVRGDNLPNEDMFVLIDKYHLFDTDCRLLVIYEDIRPFTSRFNMDTINTCKIIGRLEYVLKQQRIPFRAITRNEVKAFVFNKYGSVAIPEIEKKIAKKGRVNKDGKALKPSFQYVDDRIVKQAMKKHWSIETPKPGKSDPRGIKTHVWQALGTVTCYFNIEAIKISGTF